MIAYVLGGVRGKRRSVDVKMASHNIITELDTLILGK